MCVFLCIFVYLRGLAKNGLWITSLKESNALFLQPDVADLMNSVSNGCYEIF